MGLKSNIQRNNSKLLLLAQSPSLRLYLMIKIKTYNNLPSNICLVQLCIAPLFIHKTM